MHLLMYLMVFGHVCKLFGSTRILRKMATAFISAAMKASQFVTRQYA